MATENLVRNSEDTAPNKQESDGLINSVPQQQELPHQDESALAEGWKKWKRSSGSAQNSVRKFSSIDPLSSTGLRQLEPEPAEEETIKSNPTALQQATPKSPSIAASQVPWYEYINPFTYVPQNIFPTAPNARNLDTQSNYSSSTLSHSTSQQSGLVNGWLGWLIPSAKSIDTDEGQHDLVTSVELKKSIKEAKKAIQNQDSVWAWYQNHHSLNTKYGEISVIGTKTETNPVELSKYPHIYSGSSNDTNETNHDDLGTGEVVPKFIENYRNITNKTKVRIATEIYYNYPTEKHLYIKNKVDTPVIQYSLVISITGQPKLKNHLNPNHLNEIITESVKTWYETNSIPHEYQVETIALEAAKLTLDSLEDLFKLLINWREDFKKIQHVLVVGYRNTVPLSFALLEILISRNLFDNGIKFGALSIDGIIPGPYLDNPAEQALVQYLKVEDFEKIVFKLVDSTNVKITILGTLNNLSSSLALHLNHPNIFRSIYLPKNSYDDAFEKQLFKLLLTSMNLGINPARLLLQISKYFNAPTTSTININDDLTKGFFTNTVDNTLRTTSLFHKRPVLRQVINDPILTNDFNLIWTFHAFIDEFKKIKNINSLEDIKTMLKLYKTWDPQSKGLKELKYMLEVLQIEDYSGTIFTL